MICIICKTDKADDLFSKEHIFPDAIGGTLTINNVCKKCNDYLGHSVDIHLIDNWFIQTERYLLQIAGKSGNIPNPLENGILAENPNQRVRYSIDTDGNKNIYVTPDIQRFNQGDGTERIKISIDATDEEKLPLMINKMLKRKGKEELSIDQIKNLMVLKVDPTPSIKQNFSIDMVNYKRAILKIVYELAWLWLGEQYLSDPTSEVIRTCILDDNLPEEFQEQYPIKGTIELYKKDKEEPFEQLWKEDTKAHIAYMIKDQDIIWCKIKIFDVFEGTVQISEHSNMYPGYKDMFVSIQPSNSQTRHSTFEVEIERLTKEE